MNPKVSVCIPVYNVEKYISRCIESILSQSLKEIEILVINDCTPDSSMEIVKTYAEKDNRLKIIKHDINRGPMAARATGYLASTGDYITFCDSDDALPKNALSELYSAAIRENADIVSGTIKYVPIEGASYSWVNKLLYGSDKISVFKSLLKNEFGHNVCSKLFRKELLCSFSYKIYEHATNGEDGMLFYQVVDNASKVIVINSIAYEYHENVSSSTHIHLSQKAIDNIVLCNKIREEICSKYDELKKLMFKRISINLYSYYICGYKDELKCSLNKYNMNQYLDKFKMIRYLGLYDMFKMLYKYLKRSSY